MSETVFAALVGVAVGLLSTFLTQVFLEVRSRREMATKERAEQRRLDHEERAAFLERRLRAYANFASTAREASMAQEEYRRLALTGQERSEILRLGEAANALHRDVFQAHATVALLASEKPREAASKLLAELENYNRWSVEQEAWTPLFLGHLAPVTHKVYEFLVACQEEIRPPSGAEKVPRPSRHSD